MQPLDPYPSGSSPGERAGPLDALVRLHQEVQHHEVSFCYRGPFLERFTHTILEIYEAALQSRSGQPMINRKVSFLLVECFQNILRHGENMAGEVPDFQDDGLFSFRSAGDEFVINSINLVQQEEVESLRALMDNINSLDGERLKELYLRQLNQSELSAKGGAGLGMIELARRSGREVLYTFDPAPGGMALFHQQITLTLLSRDLPIRNMIDDVRDMYFRMSRENTLLYYKGDFSQKSILPLLEMVEHNVASGTLAQNLVRRTGHVLIELLQNISRHGSGEEGRPSGIFTVGLRDRRVILQTGNEVSAEEKAFLLEKLEYLTGLNRQDLMELHKIALRASLKFENKHKSGLGLIEVARASSEPIRYLFRNRDNEAHLFALQVAI